MNALEQLKQFTRVVADTGDFESIEAYRPVDATTNPSLIYASAKEEKYRHLAAKAAKEARALSSDPTERMSLCLDRVAVNFGLEILKIVPGRVSTEVDARLSFDVAGTIAKARTLIRLYEAAGIGRERILIKVAATWEGIRAAEVLEKEGIHCNLTLLFSEIQAIACAEAGVTLISPFVGRILDWYKKEKNFNSSVPAEDPGVVSVTGIFNYYKKFGYTTEVMGASFRNKDEIIALAGCDLLTVAPSLLKELELSDETVVRMLDPERAADMDTIKIHADEASFRWLMNEDAMATDKLADGIRRFTADLLKLEDFLKTTFSL
ncbi:MAG TPA: transaldolase [Lentimicrobium sp.]|jgi:transaldolase|nr:transaldolase [Lentimicrobium sp.]